LRKINFSYKTKDIDEYDIYVPRNIGIGGGACHIEFTYCFNCGMIQDSFPKYVINKEDM
jgi:hypothetical protein